MKAIKMNDGIYWVGANISSDDPFEGIWPIPRGVTLNSYAVIGDKIAVIDLVREWVEAPKYFFSELKSIGIELSKIDYIVLNHLEPDHTGILNRLDEFAPNAKLVTTKKGAELVKHFYRNVDEDRVQVVDDGDIIDLGQGKELSFYSIPHVHWPETMVTYEKQSKIVFTCDAFGSFGTFKGSIFDDETCAEDHRYFREETLRYYSNIVANFSPFVLKAIDKLKGLEIKMIAPSHGLVWRKNISAIIERYRVYANYAKDFAEPIITIVWGSMYGNTENMLRSVIKGISSENVHFHIYRVPYDEPSFILSSAWESAGLIFGMPTYEYKMFHPMAEIIDLFVNKKVRFKKVFRFGSYGWSGGAQKEFDEKTAKQKWDIVEPVEFRGAPTEADLKLGFQKGAELARMIKNIPRKLNEHLD